jgi:peroxiredoxin
MLKLILMLGLVFNFAACQSEAPINPTMEEIPLGKMAPDFKGLAHDAKTYSLSQFKDKYVVLEWLNFDCPFVVKHYHEARANMQNLQKKWTDKGVVWISIISSAQGKQGHLTVEQAQNLKQVKNNNASLIILDESGDIGRLYGAKTTPHMYVIAPSGEVIYRGAIDDKPSTEISSLAGATNYVDQALEAHQNGQKILVEATKAYGCSVKY